MFEKLQALKSHHSRIFFRKGDIGLTSRGGGRKKYGVGSTAAVSRDRGFLGERG